MIYAVPAVLGLLIKLSILYFAKTSHLSKAFILFISLLSIHNFSELLLFYHFFTETDATIALRMYYSCLAGVLAGMSVYATQVSKPEWLELIIKISMAGFTIFCGLTMFTSFIVEGFVPIDHGITAIKGSYYAIFQSIAVCAMAYTLFVLVRACRTSKKTQQKIRSAYVLASLFPAIIIALAVLALMQFGIELNAMTVLPIGTTLIVLITLKAENKHNLTDIRMYLPFSKERQTSQDLIKIMSDYSVSEKDYKETVRDIERILFSYSYEKSNYCKSTTARKLNVSRSTLYGMLHRLDLKK